MNLRSAGRRHLRNLTGKRTLVALAILPLAFIRRMRYEEELLLERFGQEYKSYQTEVRKILPGVW